MTDAERLQMTRERNAQIRAEREAREAAAAQKLIDDAWARLARYGEKSTASRPPTYSPRAAVPRWTTS